MNFLGGKLIPDNSLVNILLTYGPMGALLAYGMWMLPRIMDRLITRFEYTIDKLTDKLTHHEQVIRVLTRAIIRLTAANQNEEVARKLDEELDRIEMMK